MSQPLPPTLSAIRRSVAVRCGLAQATDVNARHRELIDEFIRKAQREIFLRASWARLRRTASIPLVTGQVDYDIPDATYVGGIITLEVVNLSNNNTQLTYDDSRDLQAYENAEPTQPQWWRVVNDNLRILPQPNAADFPALYMEYELGLVDPVNDQDRVVCDGEAVVQLAVLSLKAHLGTFGDTSVDKATFLQYLKDMRSYNNPSRMYGQASRDWQGPIYVRLNSYPTGAGTGPYSPTWAPWA